jgi:hypothetical protein
MQRKHMDIQCFAEAFIAYVFLLFLFLFLFFCFKKQTTPRISNVEKPHFLFSLANKVNYEVGIKSC